MIDIVFAEIEKSVIHFKLRVLDLVEIFIRKELTNPLILVSQYSKCEYCQLTFEPSRIWLYHSTSLYSHLKVDETPPPLLTEWADSSRVDCVMQKRYMYYGYECMMSSSYIVMMSLCMQYPKVGLDVDHVHSQLSKLTQYLYKGNAV